MSAVAIAAMWAPAVAAPPSPMPQEDDFNYLQLGLLTERVAIELYDRALKGKWSVEDRQGLLHLKFSDMRHEGALAGAMNGEAPSDDDFTVVLPKGALHDKASVLALARRLERLTVAVYAAGVEGAQDPATRRLLATLLAQDAQHLSLIATLRGAPVVTDLPGPIGPERAGDVLDQFLAVPDAPDIPEDQPAEGTAR